MKTLLYRTRQNNGRELVDEEAPNWMECLHRYDKNVQANPHQKASADPIVAAIDKLYSFKTINYTKKARRRKGTLFLDYELSPPDMWSGIKYSEYLKIRSSLDITHEDYSNAVESHPYLPLYVTGNQKGLLCLWNYEQTDDKSLD